MKDEIAGRATQEFAAQIADITKIIVLIQKLGRIHAFHRAIFSNTTFLILVLPAEDVFVKGHGVFGIGFASRSRPFFLLTMYIIIYNINGGERE
jgi:hypothetical protein